MSGRQPNRHVAKGGRYRREELARALPAQVARAVDPGYRNSIQLTEQSIRISLNTWGKLDLLYKSRIFFMCVETGMNILETVISTDCNI